MKKNMCLFERISKVGIGSFFLLVTIGFILSGFTVFPFLGFLFAIPALLVSIFFFRAHVNQNCQIEFE
jgi:hypothetical protein